MGGEGGLMSLKTEGASWKPRGLAWPWCSSHLPTKAASRGRRVWPCQRRCSVAVAGCQPQDRLFGFGKRKEREREKPCPQDSEGSHSGSVM